MKTVLIATAAIATFATAASADNYFGLERNMEETSVIELDVVRAEANGVVEVYDYHGGEIGDLLGSEGVFAGANGDVRVNLGGEARRDVIALLKIDGEVVATQEIDIQ